MRAGVALAALDEGCEITLETRIRDIEAPIGRVDRRVSCHSRGVNTVKGVGTGCYTCEEILGLGDTQQVAGTVLTQFLAHPRHDRAQVLLLERSAHAEAVEALAVHLHVGHRARCLAT